MSLRFKLSGLPDDMAARFTDVDCSNDVSPVVQADAKELDINRIVARLQRGQAVPSLGGQPFYGDVSELGGLQEALIKVREADELFMSYPAELRERFENDPVKMVDFLSDPGNLDEAVKLGLAQPRPVDPVEPPSGIPESPK